MNFSDFSYFTPGFPGDPGKFPEEVSSEWQSPSNIALIKYWGKKEGQIPANPSLSMTLGKAITQTRVDAVFNDGNGGLLSVNDDQQHPFLPKLNRLFHWLADEIHPLKNYSCRVKTMNTFPHSTGIASSASGISAFSLCLLSIAVKITGKEIPENKWKKMASEIARIGSGSACRSIFGGFTLWGETPLVQGSSDEYAVPVNDLVNPLFHNLQDAIMVVSGAPKEISSSEGHSLMTDHPFAGNRSIQAAKNLKLVLQALQGGDFELLGKAAENEALTLHAMIMTSDGNPVLFAPGTISIIKRVQQERKKGLPLFFTLDAGANVHLIYPGEEKDKINNLIASELSAHCENGQVIYDSYGCGPVKVTS